MCLDRRHRQPEQLGGLGVGQPLDIAEQHDDAMVFGEVAERRANSVDDGEPVGVLVEGVVGEGGRVVSTEIVDRHRRAAPPSEPHEGDVRGDPVQPGEHRRLGAKPVAVTPGLHEGVLNRLLDVARVIEETPDDRGHPSLIARDQIEEVVDRFWRISWTERIVHGAGCIEQVVQIMAMLRHGTCLGARRRFDDLCDGELPTGTAERVRRHATGCRRCGRVLRGLEATIADLGELDELPPTEVASVRNEVRDELERGDSR